MAVSHFMEQSQEESKRGVIFPGLDVRCSFRIKAGEGFSPAFLFAWFFPLLLLFLRFFFPKIDGYEA